MARRLTGGVPNHGRPYISAARGGTFTKRNGMWVPYPMRRYGMDVMQGATAWYDTRDLTSTTQQTLPNRLNPSATAAQLGSTSGSDTNDPLALPHNGTAYVYLPGTASNNLSIPKDGGWAATLHVTATLTDDTTATFTTTASPILIGNTLITAGRYKKFVVRDTDGNGTVRVTIEPSVETLGQTSWTCTTGQTVTVNRSTSGLTTAVVTRPELMLDGTDDYLQLPAEDAPTFTATTGAYTVLMLYRRHVATAASALRLFSSESASAKGLMILTWGGDPYMRGYLGGATSAAGVLPPSTYVASELEIIALVVSNGTSTAYRYSAGFGAPVTISGFGAFSFAAPRIGISTYAAANVLTNSSVASCVIWANSAKSAAELDTVSAFLLGSYS